MALCISSMCKVLDLILPFVSEIENKGGAEGRGDHSRIPDCAGVGRWGGGGWGGGGWGGWVEGRHTEED